MQLIKNTINRFNRNINGMGSHIVYKKQQIKCNNLIKQYKNDQPLNVKRKHSSNNKTDKKHNNHADSIIDKIYLHFKDPNEAKYHYVVIKHENIGLKDHEGPKTFFECSNNMKNKISKKILISKTQIANVKY